MINKDFFITCFLSVILFFTSFAAYANDDADRLAEMLSNVNSMQADFEQNIITKSGQATNEPTIGKMSLLRPGKFRWETTSPMKQLIIADGKYVWVYDADLEQVTKNKIDYHQPGNPAMLLSGSVIALQKTFTVNVILDETDSSWFQLNPKSKNNMYQWIKLHFTNGKITEMFMADNLGQQSEIQFKNIKMNQTLSNSLFTFKPPKNVDVITE